jgi:hypothetical protein
LEWPPQPAGRSCQSFTWRPPQFGARASLIPFGRAKLIQPITARAIRYNGISLEGARAKENENGKKFSVERPPTVGT